MAAANQCEEALKAWIYEVTKQEPQPEPLMDALRNGQLLCHLANALDPTCNLKINQLMTVFHTRENISRFLDWGRAQRVGEQNLFHAEHLLDDNFAEHVFKTLILLYEQYGGGTQLALDSYNLRDNVTKKNEKSGKKQNQGTLSPIEKGSDTGSAHEKADLELGGLEKDKTADKKRERLTPFMMGKNFLGVKTKQLSMFNRGKSKKNHDQTSKSLSPQSPVSDTVTPLEENQSVWLHSPSRISAVDDEIGKSHIQGLSKLASFVKQVPSISSNNDAHELDCPEKDHFVMQTDPRPMCPRKSLVNKSGTPVTVSSCKDTMPTRIENDGDIKSTTACTASPYKAKVRRGARKKLADFLKANPPTDQERKRVHGDAAQLSQASTMEKPLRPISTHEENSVLDRPAQIENSTSKVMATNKKLMTFLQKQPPKEPTGRGFPVSVPCSVERREDYSSRLDNDTSFFVKEVSSYPFGRRKYIKRSTGQSNFVRNRQTYRNLLQRKPFDLESKRSQFMIEQLQIKEAKRNGKSTTPSDTNIAPGMQCYVPDDEHVWLPAQIVGYDEKAGDVEVVVSFEEEIAETRFVDLHNPKNIIAIAGPKATKVESLPLAWTGDTIEGVEDMQSLRFLNEASILYNLRKRFLASLPYTFTSTIVIALNPYKWMDSLYGDELSKLYMKGYGLKKLQPHVYATSAAAYQHLLQTGSNQSILVSGESGAGKTETTKIIMHHLTSIAGGLDDSTVDKVIRVNPLLESFGNAKTSRNDNSSRFGKFTQLQFDASGILVGAKCEAYLLEKSRVVSLVQGERNYHIFYQLLAGASEEERQQLQLDTNKSFRYLGNSSEQTAIDGFDDAKRFTATRRSLSLIGLENDQQFTLFKILAGLLHLGEVQFMKTDDEEGSASQNVEQLCVVSEFLGLAATKVEGALCTRSVVARNESVTVSLSVADAEENRDSLAKAIYSKIFEWMVRRINQAIAVDDDVCSGQIGVLDIFGFEEFAHNGFEQFCINYANEKLQQKFTLDVFKTVEKEYTREALQWDHIEYPDNRDIIELIEGKMGILALMNDHLRQPRGSEEALVNKIRASADSQLESICIQFPKVNRTQFTINHFAGPVTYETVGFMEKHRDTLQKDLLDLVLTSELDLVTEFFGSSEAPRETKMLKSRKSTTSKKSLGTQFKSSLSQLMDNIETTNTHYVRCIKPNANKSSTEFDNRMVIEQLRSAGVIEAIRISRSGYPSRLTPHELATKYCIMFPPSMQRKDVSQTCSAFMAAIGRRSPLEYQIGKSLIYFKHGVLEELEAMKSDFYYIEATCIQKVVLGYLERQRFRRMIEAVTTLQAWSRMVLERAEYQYLRNAVITIQRAWKRYLNEDLIKSGARGHSYDNMQENDFVRMSDGEWVDEEDADDRLTEGSESSFECSEPVTSAFKNLKVTQSSHTQLSLKRLSYELFKRDSTSHNPSLHRTLNMDEISESAKRILDAVERKENLEPISLQEENTILRWENRNLKYDLEMMREQCKDLQSIIVEINRSRKR